MKPLVNIIHHNSSWWTSCSSFHPESHSVTETDSCVLCSLSLKPSKRSARKQSPTAELTQIWWHGSFQPQNIEHIRASRTCSALTKPSLHTFKKRLLWLSLCSCKRAFSTCPAIKNMSPDCKTLWGQIGISWAWYTGNCKTLQVADKQTVGIQVYDNCLCQRC